MQKRIDFNTVPIKQPDKCDPVFATTSTEDSDRNMVLVMKNTVLGTVYGYDMEWSELSLTECATILQQVLNKSEFSMYHLSSYHGTWRRDKFYASNVNIGAKTLKDGEEKWESLSINVRSINPL